ncbi:hypothetical protein C4571_03440 [Candidatus Parcubacteria bacterium]|nr:MAG: hypothetical protein C4571_03440 [Candidatus Parcubacteria bacterium]
MKNKTTNVIAGIVGLAVLGVASLAGAQATSTATSTPPVATSTPQVLEMPGLKIEITPSGNALLQGTLTGITSSSLTVKSWGGVWTARLSSSTELMRRFGGKANLSEFKVGDVTRVRGKIDANASFTIDASSVRDFSIMQIGDASAKIEKKIEKEIRKDLKEEKKEERREEREESRGSRNFRGPAWLRPLLERFGIR